jgi:hypothetical protein
MSTPPRVNCTCYHWKSQLRDARLGQLSASFVTTALPEIGTRTRVDPVVANAVSSR